MLLPPRDMFHLSFANCYFLRWRGGPSRQASQRNANRDKTGGQGDTRDNNARGVSRTPQEKHIPVRGFNRAEVKDVLKKDILKKGRRSNQA